MAKNPFLPAKTPNAKFVDVKHSAGILDDFAIRKDVQSKTASIQKLTISNRNGSAETLPLLSLDYTDTGSTIDRALSIKKNGTEILYVGEVADIYTGIVNPNVNGGKILFGMTNDTLTDIESVFVCNTTTAFACAPTYFEIQIPFATPTITISSTQMIFYQTGDDPTFDWGTAGELRLHYANLSIETVGKGIDIKEGTNARMGVATLSGGTVTVSTTQVTATSRIYLTPQNSGGSGSVGAVSVRTRTAGTSFDIQSSDDTDDRDIAWMIVNPA